MSQRFYGFTLIILFISINLLSMNNYELNKRLNYSKNAKKNHSVLFKSPSSMPCFKQQSIVLHNNDASQYSLVFNRSQQPCITQYLLDGKSVAKLIQIDDEINFTTVNGKTCTFSLQIPYQAGSLTINTQGRFIFEKKIDVYSAYITGKKIDFYDEFFSHNCLIVQADKCKSHNQLTCCNLLFKGKKFKIMPKSSLNMHNSLTLTAQSLIANGGIVDCKKESFITSSLFKNSGTFIADNANLTVNETIQNEGTIDIKHHLSAHSRYISNAGKIAANSLDIKADRYFYNKIFSTLHAKNNLTIHTPLFLNLSGLTHAQNFTINSAIGLNILGIYAAKNMDFNSFASINAGLFLPKFGTFAETCSWHNIWRLGESIFSTLFPVYGLKYTMLKNIFTIFQQGKTLCSTVSSLYKKGNIEVSNRIVLICLIKNIFSSAKQTYNLNKSHPLLSHSSTIEEPQKHNFSSEIAAQSINIVQQLPATLMSLYAPNVNTDAVFDDNYGVTIGINNNSSSLYNRNLNTSLYVNNTINTRNGENVGNLGAYNLNIKATNVYRSVSNKGNRAYINGNITAKNINIQSDNNIEISSHLTSSNTHLYSREISQQGTITADQVVMTGDIINNSGTVKAPKIIINQAHLPYISYWCIFSRTPSGFCNMGSLQASDQFFVDAANIRLDKKSNIDAQNACFQSNFNFHNDGHLKTEQCVIDAQNQAINNGTINANELFQVKAHNIHFINTSDVITKNAYFQSNFNFQNDGQLKIEQCFIDVQKQAINNGSINASKLLQVKAQNIHLTNTSDITTKKAFFKINSNTAERSYFGLKPDWQNDGQLKTEQCAIDAQNRAINNGIINASELFQVKSKNVHLTKNSSIVTKKAFFKTNSNTVERSFFGLNPDWHNDGQLNTDQCFIDVQGQVINNGTINVNDLLNVEAQNISFQQESNVKAKDAYYTADQSVRLDGVLDVEKGTIDAGGKVTAIGKIGASNQLEINAKDIILEATSNVCTNDATLKAKQTIHNQGTLAASKLLAHAKYVENSGTINSNNAHIKADRCFWNQIGGSINVENNLKIDAFVLLNTLGYIRADSLCTNSAIDLNLLGIYAGNNICTNSMIDVNWLGIYAGNNICRSSFISYNRGILMPTLKSLDDLEKLLKTNKWKFAESFMLQIAPQLVLRFIPRIVPRCMLPFVPQLGKIYSLSKTVVMCFSDKKNGLWGQGKSLIKNITDVTDLYKKGDLYVSDVLPVFFQAKNMFTTVAQTGHSVYQVGQQVAEEIKPSTKAEQSEVEVAKQTYQEEKPMVDVGKPTYQSIQNYLKGESCTISNSTQDQKATNEMTWPSFQEVMSFAGSQISAVASIAGPQISRDSLLDVNGGLIFGVNGNYQSLYSANYGGSFFANNHFVNTISGINTGIMSGGNIVVDAFSSYISDGIAAAANISLLASDLVVAGKTYACNNAFFKAHNSAVLDREITAHNVTVHAQDLLIKENASIDVNTATISAQSMRGEKGNIITSQNGTLIKTDQIDNHGTINGSVALEFNGKAHELESIGSVDHLMYSGTLENNIADKLANGHNALLNVHKDGAVFINAQEQDVHLKEQHDISHTFCVQTNGAITCDQDLLSDKSLWLQAQGDIQHASVRSKGTTALIGKNISSQGHVTREDSGENYAETCQESNVSGKNVIIQAQEDLRYKSTHVHSGIEGTQLFVGKKLIADALEVQEYSKTEEHEFGKIRKKTIKLITTTENKTTTSVPCAFTSDGATDGYVGNVAELHGTIFDSKGGGTIHVGSVEQVLTYDTHIQNKETKQQGINNVTTQTQSVSIKEKPLEFRGETPPVLISDKPVSLHIKCNAPSITINAPEVEINTTKQTTHVTSCKDGRYLGVWDRKTNTQSHDVIADSLYSGTINTNAQAIYIEKTIGSVSPTINATYKNACITSSLIEHVHQRQKQSYNRPTPLAMSLIALSLSIALQGVGSSLGAALVTKLQIKSAVMAAMTKQAVCGTVNALCMETLTTLANCNGDLKKAAQELASKQTIRTIAITAIMAAATGGAHQLLDKVIPSPSQATTFGQCLASAASRELITNGIRAGGDIAQGKDPKKAVKDRLKLVAANSLGVACSRQIGQAYGDGKIGSGTHKGLHTGLGALQGAILDGKNGAIAGAIGAGVAETIADVARPKLPSLDDISKIESQQGRPLTHDEFTAAWNKQLAQYLKQTHSIADASKMIATAVAALAHQDINIAYDTATKAVDNNFLILVGYGVVTASVAYSAYQINNAYKEGGAQAALQRLGVEVVTQAAFGAATKIGFKVGRVMYPTAKVAIAAVLESVPGLKFALGGLADTLAVAGKKIGESALGKSVSAIEAHLVNATDKVTQKLGKCVNHSFAEDLVEHVVPNSVISKMEAQVGKQVVENVETTIVQKLGNLTKPDLVMTTPEGIKISVPDTGKVGLLQRSDNVGESINKRVKSPLTSNVVSSEPSIKTENIGVIKSDLLSSIKKHKGHIFSEDHEKKGILALGKNREEIMDSLRDVIISLDKKGLITEGSNQLRVKINEIDNVEIRCCIKNGEAISINAFISDFGRIFKNFIDTTKV